MRSKCLAALLCMLAIPAASELSAATFYPLGEDVFPSSVSPNGELVLADRLVWSHASGFMPHLPTTPELYPRDISNNGIVSGLWCGSNTGSCYEAFRAPIGGPLEGLGAFDNWHSDAFGMTPYGSVLVGNASSPAASASSFRWTAATGLVDLGNLVPEANSHSTAYAVSADGCVIVGQSGDDVVLEAYRWTEATGMVGLGDLDGGSFSSSAREVSADGKVVVGTATTDGGMRAFRWTETTGMEGLGDLDGGEFMSVPHATSAMGDIIVGEGSSSAGAEAFIWTSRGGLKSLREVLVSDFGLDSTLEGWHLEIATDISHDGKVIVGYGLNPAGKREGFVLRVPEPGSMILAVILSLSIAGGCQRRRT